MMLRRALGARGGLEGARRTPYIQYGCSTRTGATAAGAPGGRRRAAAAVVASSARGSSGSEAGKKSSATPVKTPESARKKPPMYKVLLHNDSFNRREYVVKVLMTVVDQLTVEDALAVMQEAHVSGVALVVACDQDKAEGYVEELRLNGLTSTMEPGH